jgi:hypothetical protein
VIKQNKVRHAQPCAEQELALSRTREGSQQNSGNKDGRSRRNAVRVPSAGIRINIRRLFRRSGKRAGPARMLAWPDRYRCLSGQTTHVKLSLPETVWVATACHCPLTCR